MEAGDAEPACAHHGLCYRLGTAARPIDQNKPLGEDMRIAIWTLTSPFLLAGLTGAMAASATGPAALALAGVVAPISSLSSAEKTAVAMLFAGNSNISHAKAISVKVDKIVCRTSNVDITARSCQLTIGKSVKTINGRAANELFATEAVAGVPSDGAAGSIFESLSKLNCTLDPAKIKQKDGSGAECSFDAGN
jgi:hypothetical protein